MCGYENDSGLHTIMNQFIQVLWPSIGFLNHNMVYSERSQTNAPLCSRKMFTFLLTK